MSIPSSEPKRRFQFILIKPSRYDDDGYVIQWARAYIPPNSLAVLYSLARDAARRTVLGPDVEIDVTVVDEFSSRVSIKQLLARIRRHDGFGLVGFVGVQSNQFPRALDLAGPFRAAGVPVIIGGFHVSGTLAMIPELQPELKTALDMGISLFAGEVEGRLDGILQDAANGTLKPVYDYLKDLPALESQPTPILPAKHLRRTVQSFASFDAGRGCPYQCSFCVIINVQGKKSRGRSVDDVERAIREHWAHGIRHFGITDDNFARHKDWEAILDRIIELRERDKMNIRLMIQADMLCHKIPNFIEKAGRAGANRVFVGLESINPANLVAAKKRQNKITEYRKNLLAWKKAGAIVTAGYIIGFPFDTAETIAQDIEIIKKELPLDILGFTLLCPLPGSEDHKVLWEKGVWMDPDLNLYDAEHMVTNNPLLSKEQWVELTRSAWRAYYTPEHIETILRRAEASYCSMSRLIALLWTFSITLEIERIHPYHGGVMRRKYRRDRRPGMPIEPIWSFYPKFAWDFATKYYRSLRQLIMIARIARRVRKDPNRHSYTDQAMTPVSDEETERLELFTHSDTARQAVEHAHKVAHLTGATAA
jgi:radical SAM superfamily enzyme YgiQ (UPF0313 family)